MGPAAREGSAVTTRVSAASQDPVHNKPATAITTCCNLIICLTPAKHLHCFCSAARSCTSIPDLYKRQYEVTVFCYIFCGHMNYDYVGYPQQQKIARCLAGFTEVRSVERTRHTMYSNLYPTVLILSGPLGKLS